MTDTNHTSDQCPNCGISSGTPYSGVKYRCENPDCEKEVFRSTRTDLPETLPTDAYELGKLSDDEIAALREEVVETGERQNSETDGARCEPLRDDCPRCGADLDHSPTTFGTLFISRCPEPDCRFEGIEEPLSRLWHEFRRALP